QKGFQASSIQDIIDTCSISKGTLYNYFASKNDFLVAYLDVAREEEYQRRNSMVNKSNKTNKTLFKKQVLVRIKIINEFSLWSIYEATFHSEDQALKAYINNRLFEEMSWLAGRLAEIYGEESVPYTSDGAIIMHGMMQHMFYAWRVLKDEKV